MHDRSKSQRGHARSFTAKFFFSDQEVHSGRRIFQSSTNGSNEITCHKIIDSPGIAMKIRF